MITVKRETIDYGGHLAGPQPFTVGEHLNGYPHSGRNGLDHKGNLRVVYTDGKFDDSGSRGLTAKAKCVLPTCVYQIDITAVGN